MQKWSLNNHTVEVIQSTSDLELQKSIFERVKDRKGFSSNETKVIIPRYFLRVIGIEDKESGYFNYLLDLKKSLERHPNLFLLFEEGMAHTIPSDQMKRLNMFWAEVLFNGEVSAKTIVDKLYSEGMLIDFPNENTSKQIKGNLQGLLEYYFSIHHFKVEPNELKQLIYYLVFWTNTYVENLFMNFDFTDINPKVVFYGDISKEEIYFLIYLASLGCDVIYFNPEKEYFFEEIDKGFSIKVEFPRKINMQPFPKKRIVERVSTVALGASEEINSMLSSGEIAFYRPWSLIDHKTQSVTLKTTYPEIAILSKEPTVVRPGWKVEDDTVFIPNLFAKISGVHADQKQYWREFNTLADESNALFFKSLPITNPLQRDSRNAYVESLSFLDETGMVSEEKLLKSKKWPYQKVNRSIQKRIAHEIAEICNKPEIQSSTSIPRDTLRGIMIMLLFEVEESYIKLLQNFDFSKNVPRIVIFNDGNQNFNFEEALVLQLMNRLGVDIFLFNPSGQNDIEHYLPTTLYDTHMLENMVFDLEYKNKQYRGKDSFFFNRFFSN